MVAISSCWLYVVAFLVCSAGSMRYVQSYPPSAQEAQEIQEAQQEEMQQQQQDESISDNFFDEVRQLIEQKLLHSSETTVDVEAAAAATTSTTSSPISNVDEQQVAQQHSTTQVVPKETSVQTYPTVNSPKPKQVSDWPKWDLRLGQVTAVAIGIDGHPVIFHRADRVWTEE